MTQDEIIEMAKQSGMEIWKRGHRYMDDFDIHKFANLVAQHEREACAEHYLGIMRDAVKNAVETEREACAKVCEGLEHKLRNTSYTPNGFSCAAAIRARGQE